MAYASYQGKLHLAKIVDGVVQAMRFVGNVPELTVETDSEKLEHKESHTGQRATDFTMTKTKSVTVSAKLEDFDRDNLALAVSGNVVSVKSESITNHVLGTVKAGDMVKLKGFNVSNIVIKDSTTSAKTLEKGIHYTIDEKLGKVIFTTVDGFKQPFMADYTTGQVEATTIMSADDDEYQVYFEGVNTITNENVILELWRMKKQAKGSVPFIHEELGEIDLAGDALADTSKQNDASLGLFGRVVVLPK